MLTYGFQVMGMYGAGSVFERCLIRELYLVIDLVSSAEIKVILCKNFWHAVQFLCDVLFPFNRNVRITEIECDVRLLGRV